MKNKIAMAVATALVSFAGVSSVQAAPFSALDKIEKSFKANKQFKGDELILKFAKSATPEQRKSILAQLGVDKPGKTLTVVGGEPLQLVKLKGITVENAVRLLAGVPTVDVAEPNWVVRKQFANDPLVGQDMWNLYGPFGQNNQSDLTQNDFGTDAISTFRASMDSPNCSNVVIGMLDTGVYANHSDLYGNIWINPKEVSGNGSDDDVNGYADDVNGYNFVDGNANINIAESHGTHVAGVMAAVGGNGTGISGICQAGKVVVARIIDPATGVGTTAAAIAAVDYLTKLKTSGTANIVAVNNSWGDSGYSKALEDAYVRAGAANIVHVMAAGNAGTNNDTTPSYPASYRLANTISVAAIDSAGNLYGKSNFGANTVDIAAPGVSILSTSAVGPDQYEYQTGTSAAAPHVTGAAALYVSQFPNASVADIKQALFQTARANPVLAGKVAVGGELNVSSFAQVPPTQPYVPPTNDDTGTGGGSTGGGGTTGGGSTGPVDPGTGGSTGGGTTGGGSTGGGSTGGGNTGGGSTGGGNTGGGSTGGGTTGGGSTGGGNTGGGSTGGGNTGGGNTGGGATNPPPSGPTPLKLPELKLPLPIQLPGLPGEVDLSKAGDRLKDVKLPVIGLPKAPLISVDVDVDNKLKLGNPTASTGSKASVEVKIGGNTIVDLKAGSNASVNVIGAKAGTRPADGGNTGGTSGGSTGGNTGSGSSDDKSGKGSGSSDDKGGKSKGSSDDKKQSNPSPNAADKSSNSEDKKANSTERKAK